MYDKQLNRHKSKAVSQLVQVLSVRILITSKHVQNLYIYIYICVYACSDGKNIFISEVQQPISSVGHPRVILVGRGDPPPPLSSGLIYAEGCMMYLIQIRWHQRSPISPHIPPPNAYILCNISSSTEMLHILLFLLYSKNYNKFKMIPTLHKVCNVFLSFSLNSRLTSSI